MSASLLATERLEEIVSRFSQARIAVLGDFFLDKYLDVNPEWEEPSVETGKPAHQVAAVRCYPGAAGTVVSNLSALEAGTLHAIGFTGDDGEAFELRRGLEKLRCSTDHLYTARERFTPTYLKPRDMTVPGWRVSIRATTPRTVSRRRPTSNGLSLLHSRKSLIGSMRSS